MSAAAGVASETVRDGEPSLPESSRGIEGNSVDDSIEAASSVESTVVIEESFGNIARASAELQRHRTEPRRSRLASQRGSAEMAATVAVQDGTNRTAVVASNNAILLDLETEC